jgi:hypothetical protein
MRKKLIRFGAIIIILCLMLSTIAFASVESSAYIAYTSVWFTRSGDDVNVYFSIVGRHLMDEIGVSEILLYEQNGNTWSLVCDFEADDPAYTADMLSYNASAKADHVTYSGSSSKNYYAIVYFYAADANGSDTIPYYT